MVSARESLERALGKRQKLEDQRGLTKHVRIVLWACQAQGKMWGAVLELTSEMEAKSPEEDLS